MSRRDYSSLEIEAARLVLTELFELLEEYREGIVLVGGWVPYFAIPDPDVPHEGTKDVDLALNSQLLGADGDQTIEEILFNALYQQDRDKPFRWHKGIMVDGEFVSVVVDFLTGEAPGYANGRLQRIQDIPVSTLRGCEAAFLEPVEMPLETRSATGELVQSTFLMASIPQFLVMKGLAFHNRDALARTDASFVADARKDAYDIYFIIKHYKEGREALARLIEPYLQEELLLESFQKIADKWRSAGDRGPALIAAREDDEEERKRIQRDAYEQVRALLEVLGLGH